MFLANIDQARTRCGRDALDAGSGAEGIAWNGVTIYLLCLTLSGGMYTSIVFVYTTASDFSNPARGPTVFTGVAAS